MYENFQKQHKEFVQLHGTAYSIGKTWFDRVEKCHEKLRDKIGGESVTYDIELDDIQNDITVDKVEPHVIQLHAWIPKLFIQYPKLNNNQFFTVPTVNGMDGENSRWNGKKWSKYISYWMEKDWVSPTNEFGVNDETQHKVNIYLSKLGELWGGAKTKKAVIPVTLTTNPMAFVCLGHYGVDDVSCFRTSLARYHIGQTNNSYVLLVGDVKNKSYLELYNTQNVLARYWGATNDTKTYGLCNFYAKKGYAIGNIHAAVDKFFQQLLGDTELIKTEDTLQVNHIFQNTKSTCQHVVHFVNSVFSPKIENKKSLTISGNNENPESTVCYSCGNDSKNCAADGRNYCQDCYNKLPTCEFSGLKTTRTLIEAYDIDGKKIMASSLYINNGVVLCSITNQYHHRKNIVILANGKNASKIALKEEGFEMCPECELYAKLVNSEKHGKICRGCSQRLSDKQFNSYIK